MAAPVMSFEEAPASRSGELPDPEREIDPELAKALADFRDSDLHQSEAVLAALGECPTPAEVLALEAGEIAAPWRRNALARHLIACRRCAARQLATLANGAAPLAAPAAGLARRRTQFAAAAVVLASIAASLWAARPADRIRSLGGGDVVATAWADAQGLRMRGADDPKREARVLAVAPRAGFMSLVRIDGAAASVPVIETVEGAAISVAVVADQPLVLPIDRVLSFAPGTVYLTLFTEEPIPVTELPLVAMDALRGVPPKGGSASSLIAR